jgi:DNA-binding transcriptional MerR regulator
MARRRTQRGGDGDGGVGLDGLHIQEVARMLGVSPSLLRAWERQGLVSPTRSPGGYRVYDAGDVARLRRVHRLIRGEGLNAAGARRALEREARSPRGDGSASAAAEGPAVGRRLKQLRLEGRRSLRELAAASGLSASHISAIERGLGRPSVAALQRLCAALGSSMVDVLGDGSAGERRVVVRADEGRPLRLDVPGVEIRQLSAVETQLEPLLFRLAPGAGSGESYRHAGEEFVYVLEGDFALTFDETTEHRLGAGDAMTFASTRPHRWRNPHARRECVLVWVNTPRTF